MKRAYQSARKPTANWLMIWNKWVQVFTIPHADRSQRTIWPSTELLGGLCCCVAPTADDASLHHSPSPGAAAVLRPGCWHGTQSSEHALPLAGKELKTGSAQSVLGEVLPIWSIIHMPHKVEMRICELHSLQVCHEAFSTFPGCSQKPVT